VDIHRFFSFEYELFFSNDNLQFDYVLMLLLSIHHKLVRGVRIMFPVFLPLHFTMINAHVLIIILSNNK